MFADNCLHELDEEDKGEVDLSNPFDRSELTKSKMVAKIVLILAC